MVDKGNRLFFAAHVKEGTPQPEPIRIARRGHRDDSPPPPQPPAAAAAEPAPARMDVEAMKAFFNVTYCPGG